MTDPSDASDRPDAPAGLDRRHFLTGLASAAVVLPAALVAQEKEGAVNPRRIAEAEKLVGLEFTEADRELLQKGLAEQLEDYRKIRSVSIDNSVPPALRFDPVPTGVEIPQGESSLRMSEGKADAVPADLEEVAFWPVSRLAPLVRAGKIRSVDLTRMYLARLKKLDPRLLAVITFTEERALERAAQADREIAAGKYRGPLHGIPWGAKDLLAVRGYRTTWGSVPFKEQVLDLDATVVERLDQAGAVLIAKLTLGELAWGDVWFGGMTRNPWNLEQGSSGSSAGSAAATTAGAVGFSIGTETLGSIVSPCTRTGATGLRPTFGRVSRHGAMALCWSLDKLGPICRSVEDCALVFHAIHGPDGKDDTVIDAPFQWDAKLDPRQLRVGYVKDLFEAKPAEGQEEAHAHNLAALEVLRGQGIQLRPIALPSAYPTDALRIILGVEAASAFDELTQSGKDDLMVRQVEQAWPNVFRQGQLTPAVAYVQANRIRTLLMREMAKLFADLDAYVVPSFGGTNLLLTNLTGHPAVVLPNGFRKDGTPTSLTFQGDLFGEAKVLALAKAYQDATEWHLRRPGL